MAKQFGELNNGDAFIHDGIKHIKLANECAYNKINGACMFSAGVEVERLDTTNYVALSKVSDWSDFLIGEARYLKLETIGERVTVYAYASNALITISSGQKVEEVL